MKSLACRTILWSCTLWVGSLWSAEPTVEPTPGANTTTPPVTPDAALVSPETPSGTSATSTHPPALEGEELRGAKWWDNEIIQTFTKGKFDFNARLRWEYADQDGLDPSNAVTIRPRFGFTTAPLYGFQAMIQAENVTSLGTAYNPAGLDPDEANRTPIPDPETTEINQVWLSYSNWESLGRVGRQAIYLDKQRFVGGVEWRQNMQTFDAVRVSTEIVDKTQFFYSYLWGVNRVLGEDHPAGRYNSDSHLIHAVYDPWKFLKVTGYGYLLDFDDAPQASSMTFGASATGRVDFENDRALDYRGEFAWQEGAFSNSNSYGAPYGNVEVIGSMNRFSLGADYEVLGSNNGFGFQTPLATLHKFNGWADTFLVTPGVGLQDLNGSFGVRLPWQLPLKIVYHKFWGAADGSDLGQEIDVVLSRKFGKHWSALAKYAYYDGVAGYPSRQKFWLQCTFNY